jgi:hypothetical protein
VAPKFHKPSPPQTGPSPTRLVFWVFPLVSWGEALLVSDLRKGTQIPTAPPSCPQGLAVEGVSGSSPGQQEEPGRSICPAMSCIPRHGPQLAKARPSSWTGFHLDALDPHPRNTV